MEKEKLLVTSNLSFSNNVFKSRLLLMRQNEYLWRKGLNHQMYSTTANLDRKDFEINKEQELEGN